MIAPSAFAPETILPELADSLPALVYQMYEMEGQLPWFTYMNPYIEKLYGFSRVVAMADPLILCNRVHPEDMPEVMAEFVRGGREGRDVNLQHRAFHASGRPMWVHSIATPRAIPGGVVWNGYIFEVTAKVEAERGLQEAERRTREITESLPGVVYETEYHPKHGSRMVYVTDGAQGLYGVPKEDILADNSALTKLIPLEDRARMLKEFQRSFSISGPMTQDFRIRKPSGELRWLRTHSARRQGEDGAMRWIGHTVDVTEEKRVEQELAQARLAAESANRAKSEFLANMSHEIRTPMNAILSFAYLGLRADPPPKLREYFARIESSAKTLLDLINDVLDLSKVEAGKLELERAPFDLGQVLDNLESVVGLRAQEKGLAFRIEVDADVPTALVGDALRLGQVLLNLGGNAVKFTQDGAVLVRVERIAQDGEVLLRFSISDTGIGLTPEQIGKLFQAFQQADSSTAREFGGTGLGLSICKRLVELMGGEIGVRSEPGQGSTFFFTARLALADRNAAERRVVQADGSALRGLSVMVTDDHDINRQVVNELLDSVGVRVTLAASGPEAIALAAAQRFDAIFMDMRMPGMDGLEATRRIREAEGRTQPGSPRSSSSLRGLAQRTPIIALTANVMAPDRERCLAAGMDDFVGKPIAVSELFAALARWSGRTKEDEDDESTATRAVWSTALKPAATEPEFEFETARARFGHKPQFWDQLAQDFLGGEDFIGRLRAELAAGRLDAAGIAAHTLKGFAAQVGAARVARQATRIEAALDNGATGAIDVTELERALVAARAALEKFRATQAAPSKSAQDLDRVPQLASALVRLLEADDDSAWDAWEALREAVPEATRTALASVGKLIANLEYAEALALWRQMNPADTPLD